MNFVRCDDEIVVVECGEGTGSGAAVQKTKFKWKKGDRNEIFLREIMQKGSDESAEA